MEQSFQANHPAVLCVRITGTDIGSPPESGSHLTMEEALTAKVSALIADRDGVVVARSNKDLICTLASIQSVIETVRVIGRECGVGDIGRHVALRMGIHVHDHAPQSESEWAYCVACARYLARMANAEQTLLCLFDSQIPDDLVGALQPIAAEDFAENEEFQGASFFLVTWQDQVATSLIRNPVQELPITRVERLRLRWRDRQLVLDTDSPEISLGRGVEVDISIDSEFASRRHARIRYENACFILSDDSTNGTYVNLDDSVVFIHLDQVILRGQGWISLGRRGAKALGKVVYFSTECASSPADSD